MLYTQIVDPNLQKIDQYVFRTCGLAIANLTRELESQEYAAQNFELINRKFKYRTAKITPTKTGQFVTLWQRTTTGIIAPFEINDPIDFYIIAVRKEPNLGIFISQKLFYSKKGYFLEMVKKANGGFEFIQTGMSLKINRRRKPKIGKNYIFYTYLNINKSISQEQNIYYRFKLSLFNKWVFWII